MKTSLSSGGEPEGVGPASCWPCWCLCAIHRDVLLAQDGLSCIVLVHKHREAFSGKSRGHPSLCTHSRAACLTWRRWPLPLSRAAGCTLQRSA